MNNIKVFDVYEYNYENVLNELSKKFWDDFDYHREKMDCILSKIKKINWIEVDSVQYNKLMESHTFILSKTKEHPVLECSRYCHRTLDKCYPNFNECYECFKYWCADCDMGTNSMYFSCTGKRCIRFFENIPRIFEIKSTIKRIYIFKNNNFDWVLYHKKRINRDIYGF